jgi:hypothetical protein
MVLPGKLEYLGEVPVDVALAGTPKTAMTASPMNFSTVPP